MPELRTIAQDDDGIRLDRWFKRHYPALTHGRLEKLLRKGEVRLDGKRVKAADRIIAGQSLRLPPQVIHDKVEERPRPAASVKTSRRLEDAILYMDKHLFVLNKPAGLATQGGSGLTEHVDGMLDQLAYEKTTRPKLVHRLDRDTSGVLLVARTSQAAAGLSHALASRDASKVYWALVKGVPKERHGIVKAALAKEGQRGKGERMTVSEDDDAKFALTEYAVMGTAGQEFAWVAARPVTGRTHQIRVHLASLGTPIVGDFKYGGTDAKGKGAIADKLHLHARSIDIARPDGGRLQVTAPLPAHMVKSWGLLGFDPDDKRDPFPKKKARPRSSSEAVAHRKTRSSSEARKRTRK
ncbi:MAG TPA: RluA family pseudouridine synthase [Rhizomicrobium sp.]|jgi:23S rRNA pseudouridine955/2504/2580 synthase|nr:RluA family pseudouridine synthase [Rhizomicrobium sp.]